MTRKQINASRANGALSHGPKTEEGKRISSQNAMKHGMLSKLVLIEGETAEGFEKLFAEYWKEFQPTTQTQWDLVDNLAGARWRQYRGWLVEQSTFDGAIERRMEEEPFDRITGAFPELAGRMDLVLRYGATSSREYYKAYDRLVKLQDRAKTGDSVKTEDSAETSGSREGEEQQVEEPVNLPDAA